MPLEFENVRDLGAAPTVDRLVVVADDSDIPPFIGQERDEIELETVRVLELVDHEITKFLPPAGADVFVLAKQTDREDKEIVEIDRVQAFQFSIITAGDFAD